MSMASDILLILGAVLVVLALPSFLNAYTESRSPRMAMGFCLIASACFLAADQIQPQGVNMSDLPLAFARVIGPLVR